MSFFFTAASAAPSSGSVASLSATPASSSSKDDGVDGKSLVVLVRNSATAKGRSRGTMSGVMKRGTRTLKFRDGIVFNSIGRPLMIKVPTNNAVFRVIQSFEPAVITSSTSVPTFTGSAYTVGTLDQASTLIALFDQYKIERIEVWMIPRVSTNGIGTGNPGLFHSVIDFDDFNVLGTVAQALDYTNVVMGSGLDGHYRTWVPHVATAAYSGAFTSFANETAPWIDAASASVQHYGLKTAWTVTDLALTMDVVVRLHTAWRNVR